MKAVLVLVVVLVAANQASAGLEPGFKVKFDQLGTPGVDSFFDVPLTIEQAKKENWVEKEAPEDIPEIYKELVLYCFEKCYLNVFYEKHTGYAAGLMVGLPKNDVKKHAQDMKTTGFCDWTVEIDGEKINYWAISQFFLTDFLCLSPEQRINSYDTSKVMQNNVAVLTGKDGKMMEVPVDVNKMLSETLFKEQSCIPMMGTHYYYNMTKDTDESDSMLAWFLQADESKENIIAVSFMFMGEVPLVPGVRNNFEEPTSDLVRIIVPDSPEWLPKNVDRFGIKTMHTYFIQDLSTLKCSSPRST